MICESFFLLKTCGICTRLPSYWFGLNWFLVSAQKIHLFFTLAVPIVDYKSINWRELCVHQGTWLSIFKWSNLCCWCLSMISNIMSPQSLADLIQVAPTLQDKSASYLIFMILETFECEAVIASVFLWYWKLQLVVRGQVFLKSEL